MKMLRKIVSILFLMFCTVSTLLGQVKITETEAKVKIITSDNPIEAEKTAADELVNYLQKITGAIFQVEKESLLKDPAPAIYLGQTSFAQKNGIDFSTLGDEEWVIKTVGNDLIITGGRPRGTLYAVYEFLQNTLGCWWLTYDAEIVPKKNTLIVPVLEIRGKPAFRVRSIYRNWPKRKVRNEKIMSFIARNRSNGETSYFGKYGGGYIVPPRGVHTFFTYVNPNEWFKTHPEYFSDDGTGKRYCGNPAYIGGSGSSLCLSNKDVYSLVLARLKEFIKKDRLSPAYSKNGLPMPVIYDFSQEDNASQLCRCPECKALSEQEGSDAGPVLKFVNRLAEDIQKDYPEIMIKTFAYVSSEKPPKTIRPRDNVIVEYADLYSRSDCFRPLTHPVNKDRIAFLRDWSSIAKNLKVWDYWNIWGTGAPETIPPSVISSDLNTFLNNNVKDVFIEDEESANHQNFFDLNYFIGYQLLVNPKQPYEPLVEVFMNGYYGAAAKPMKEFLKYLEECLAKESEAMNYSHPAVGRTYLTVDFFVKSKKLLKEADDACIPGSPEQLRVWRELLVVDNSLLHYWDKIKSNSKIKMPFDRSALLTEYKKIRTEDIQYRFGKNARQSLLKELQEEMEILTNRPALPAQFKNLPEDDVRDFIVTTSSIGGKADSDACARKAVCYLGEGISNAFNTDPVFLLYDKQFKKAGPQITISKKNIPGDEKYHFYKIGQFSIGPNTYLWFPWQFSINLASMYVNMDGMESNLNLYDIYVSAKFTGPAFVSGSSKPNSVCVDRVILTHPQKNDK